MARRCTRFELTTPRFRAADGGPTRTRCCANCANTARRRATCWASGSSAVTPTATPACAARGSVVSHGARRCTGNCARSSPTRRWRQWSNNGCCSTTPRNTRGCTGSPTTKAWSDALALIVEPVGVMWSRRSSAISCAERPAAAVAPADQPARSGGPEPALSRCLRHVTSPLVRMHRPQCGERLPPL